MDPLVVTAIVALVALALVALVAGRSRREAALAPVRLGPSWTPPDGADQDRDQDPEVHARRVAEVAARTDADRTTITAVLEIWDEYLGVLGLAPLPAGHRRRVYDPYDPPVARLGADGQPEPDHERVARDVASRLAVDEVLALRILRADPLGRASP